MRRMATILVMIAGPALAQDRPATQRSAEFEPMPGVDYYCTDASGERREMGDVICVVAGCQTWLAKCGMSTNTPVWRKVQDGCPGASLDNGIGDKFRILDPTPDARAVDPQISSPETEPS